MENDQRLTAGGQFDGQLQVTSRQWKVAVTGSCK